MLQFLLRPGRQTLMVCVGERSDSSHTAKIRKEREERGRVRQGERERERTRESKDRGSSSVVHQKSVLGLNFCMPTGDWLSCFLILLTDAGWFLDILHFDLHHMFTCIVFTIGWLYRKQWFYRADWSLHSKKPITWLCVSCSMVSECSIFAVSSHGHKSMKHLILVHPAEVKIICNLRYFSLYLIEITGHLWQMFIAVEFSWKEE